MVEKKSLVVHRSYSLEEQKIIDSFLQTNFPDLDIKVGDFLLGDSSIKRIDDIYLTDVEYWWENGVKLKEPKKETELCLKVSVLDDDGNYEYYHTYKEDEIKRLLGGYDNLVYIPAEEGYQRYLDECMDYVPPAMYPDGEEKGNGTSLMRLDKEMLKSEKKRLTRIKNEIKGMHRAMKHVLKKKMDALSRIRDDFQKKITRIEKVIYTIELYLGINEDVVQIQEGPSAPDKTPIYFRQRLLYMDVECDDPCYFDTGMTFENIEDFNDWLLAENPHFKKKNYEISIPEEKCVVIFRVRQETRRHDKSVHPLVRGMLNQKDMKTYIFIRNGANIFYIWADINIHPRLFPQKGEFDYNPKEFYDRERQTEDSEKLAQHYQMQALMLQGLLDRTEIFSPLREGIILLKPETYDENDVVFVHDDEKGTMIADSVKTFKEMWKELNDDISEGGRVFIYGAPNDLDDRIEGLFKNYYANKWSVPASPYSGIYTVHEEKSPEYAGRLKIMYNPGDEIYRGWYERSTERKNRLSWWIEPEHRYLINWDGIKEEHIPIIENMMYDRKNRYRNEYLWTLPFMCKLVQEKKKELAAEADFKKLLMHKSGKDWKTVSEAVEWWKLKNKWKRSLRSDDDKAFRMIMSKLKKKEE